MHAGDEVTDFELPDETGTPRRLGSFLQHGPVVLFFYPLAMSKGCTVECSHFRDLASEFARFGAERIGISSDPVDRQGRFSQLHSFDYPLLSDRTGSVARQFGVQRLVGPVRRRTFVIDTDFRLLEEIRSEIRMGLHADRALEVLAARSGPEA